MASNSGSGSPCGACKFLRRKCAKDCIFAPYFSSEQGAARFAAIHKVFGASNASKLLLLVPQADRCEAVVTIAYEAQARLKDPVYGCVGRIYALQQQVTSLQLQLMQIKAQLAQRMISSPSPGSQWQGINNIDANNNFFFQTCSSWESMSSQSSFNFTNQDYSNNGILPIQDVYSKEELSNEISSKRWVTTHAEVGELPDLAFRTIGNL